MNSSSQQLHIFQEIFMKYLTDIRTQIGGPNIGWNDSQHGLNCIYGVELEYCSMDSNGANDAIGSNQFVLPNKVNNCILNQNNIAFRKYQFDPFSQTDSISAQQVQQNLAPRNGIRNDGDFNQWTNFMLESSTDHGSNTHVGIPNVPVGNDRRGTSGAKIEQDGSVDLQHGVVTIWSDTNSTIYPKKRISYGTASIDIVDFNSIDHAVGINTEFVSPPLVNEPFNISIGAPNYVPYGTILLDNLMKHMKNHQHILFVQDCGLHIHVSKNRKLPQNLRGGNLSPLEAIGFLKLFWLFEPFLISLQPFYRSFHGFCRSIQSIFTFNELITLTDAQLYAVMMNNDAAGALPGSVDRFNGADHRYCTLNFKNLRAGGIGTVECRLGHSTFDGRAVQLQIHILQMLFQLNLAFIKDTGDHRYHESLLYCAQGLNAIPTYCFQTSPQYDVLPNLYAPITAANVGRPVSGFFVSCNGIGERSHIVRELAKLFFSCTGDDVGMRTAIDFINLYHSNQNVAEAGAIADMNIHPYYRSQSMNEINLDFYIQDYISYSNGLHWQRRIAKGLGGIREYNGPFRPCRFVYYEMFNNYFPDAGVTDLQHASKVCSVRADGTRSGTYNNGNILINTGPRTVQANLMDTAHLYRETDASYQGNKIQTELLNLKTSNGAFTGGKRKSRKNNKKLKSTKKNKKGGMEPVLKLPTMKLNKGDGFILKGKENVQLFRSMKWQEDELDKNVTTFVNKLLQQNIITFEELVILNDSRYLEAILYFGKDTEKKSQLLNELKSYIEIDEKKLSDILNH